MSILELTATFFGLLNVALIIRRSIWNYPFGILMVVLYSKIFYDAKLYSDAGLQIYFILIQIYGWFEWNNYKNNGKVIIEKTSNFEKVILGTILLIGSVLLGFSMSTYTDASFPYIDSLTTVSSVIAQYLLSRRKLENWYIWISVDLISISMYWIKNLELTSGLYFVFLIMATYGLISWKRSYLEENK